MRRCAHNRILIPWPRVFVEGVVIVGQYTGPRALWGQPTGSCNKTCIIAHQREVFTSNDASTLPPATQGRRQ